MDGCPNATIGNITFEGIHAFEVLARNRADPGPWSKTTDPDDLPPAPTNVRIVSWDNTICYIDWKAPSSDGGSPLTEYRTEYQETRDKRERHDGLTVDATQLNATVPGLNEYWVCLYRVMEGNRAGKSVPSEPSEPSEPYDVPSHRSILGSPTSTFSRSNGRTPTRMVVHRSSSDVSFPDQLSHSHVLSDREPGPRKGSLKKDPKGNPDDEPGPRRGSIKNDPNKEAEDPLPRKG